ncbi:hypothetical protein F383_05485 [Gossypium arboreum]|uniref:Uncharacterized protein n=1 Tax=Gossypium arboreum TaxID=29729 RepID=A0A0B0PJK8_GOSAR|nr:hypothetical protein F383_05485 [Gossypium arboreum]
MICRQFVCGSCQHIVANSKAATVECWAGWVELFPTWSVWLEIPNHSGLGAVREFGVATRSESLVLFW